jgi:hypothetical protein
LGNSKKVVEEYAMAQKLDVTICVAEEIVYEYIALP